MRFSILVEVKLYRQALFRAHTQNVVSVNDVWKWMKIKEIKIEKEMKNSAKVGGGREKHLVVRVESKEDTP